MPRKAMKCIVEIDLHVVTCPGTFLRDYEYVYLHMEMLGLEARTKSVPPTFPLFFHERLKFEKTFYDCTDPALVAAILKGEDIVIELRQHTDYITDGKVISHCSSNTHDFLYPTIPPYYGNGREILLYKTAKFKPIRVTGEPVKLEFSTKTVIKEVADYEGDGSQKHRVTKSSSKKDLLSASYNGSSSKSFNKLKSKSTPDLSNDFVVTTKKDENLLANRDFNTYIRPKPRRSPSPTRKARRSLSPSRSKKGHTAVESLPVERPLTSYHLRSSTEPSYYSRSMRSLNDRLDDLDLSLSQSKRRAHTVTPNLNSALRSSERIRRRVDDVMRRRDYTYLESDVESNYSLDILRESLRDERNALNEAIKEADREAFYRSFSRTR